MTVNGKRMSRERADSLWDRGRRAELGFVLAVIACSVVVPVVWEKIFPFNRPSFFVARVEKHAVYRVLAPGGRSLPAWRFGLGDFYWAQRGWFTEVPEQERGAIRLPDTVNVYGSLPSRATIEEVVRKHLRRFPELDYVVVVRTIKGPVNDRSVGVVAEQRWKVSR